MKSFVLNVDIDFNETERVESRRIEQVGCAVGRGGQTPAGARYGAQIRHLDDEEEEGGGSATGGLEIIYCERRIREAGEQVGCGPAAAGAIFSSEMM